MQESYMHGYVQDEEMEHAINGDANYTKFQYLNNKNTMSLARENSVEGHQSLRVSSSDNSN